uniref:SusD/RagB family nutrient-binding outer membrane lipoprotein n=1 Tax=Roseihalotalea indica TaxID=2867963 RepID=A0AA49GKF2_9BACT|nr:SusD/RagB family nutrient-binding outer membrane lipoprotein [Tunicatimonas sp. TK19036]
MSIPTIKHILQKKKLLWLMAGYLLPLSLLTSSCEDYLGGDTNVDPNRPSEITLEAYLPTLADATAESHYYVAYEANQVAQQLANYFSSGADIHEEFRINLGWEVLYLRDMANARELSEQATEQESPHYAGIAKIYQAIGLGLATDSWENVPFTEAFQGTEELTPAYDEQQTVYETILPNLLDDAIADLGSENSVSSPGADDVIYGGDLEQWIKTANVLKARYAIHLTNKGAQQAATQALEALSELSYESNDDDFQFEYDERNLNPWHARIALAINTGNFTIAPGAQLINMMNGDLYGVVDPRLPLIVTLNDGATEYEGMVNGTESGNTVNLRDNTWYASSEAPLLMVTYAEAKFIEAEAQFLANGGTETSVGSTEAAYQAYLAGIEAHLDKLGVEEAEKQAYLTHPNVAVGANGLTLGLILKEKYIALFLNPEAWVDLRRYDYSDQLYQGFTLPENHNPQLGNEFIQRASYPFDELSRNTPAVEANNKPLATDMWRDQ